LSRSVIVATNVDPPIIIRQHPTVVIIPVEGVPNSRDEATEVSPMNAVVADPGEPVIAADAMPRKSASARNIAADKGGGAWDTAAHPRIANHPEVNNRLAATTTVHNRIAAGHPAPGKAGPSAEAASAARDTASEMPTATAAAMTTAASDMRRHHVG